jgi:hypothetical protein
MGGGNLFMEAMENDPKGYICRPLYTMAPRAVCDHEMVRTLETHLKAVPWLIENEICAVMSLQKYAARFL